MGECVILLSLLSTCDCMGVCILLILCLLHHDSSLCKLTILQRCCQQAGPHKVAHRADNPHRQDHNRQMYHSPTPEFLPSCNVTHAQISPATDLSSTRITLPVSFFRWTGCLSNLDSKSCSSKQPLPCSQQPSRESLVQSAPWRMLVLQVQM